MLKGIHIDFKKCIFLFTLLYFSVLFWLAQPHVIDDAYISLRTAKLLGEYGEPFFNLGQKVYSSTNPLWIGIAAIFGKILNNYLLGLQIISFVAAYLFYFLFILLLKDISKSWFVAISVATLFITNSLVWRMLLSGMETPAFVLGIVLSFYSLNKGKRIYPVLISGILLFFRTDAIVLTGTFLLISFLKKDFSSLTKQLIAALLFVVLYIGFGLLVYDAPFPNSAITKMNPTFIEINLAIRANTLYSFLRSIFGEFPGQFIWSSFPPAHILVLIPFLFIGKTLTNKVKWFSAIFYSFLLLSAMVVLSNGSGHVNYTWYFVPPLLGAYVIMAKGLLNLREKFNNKVILKVVMLITIAYSTGYNIYYNRIFYSKYYVDGRENLYEQAATWADTWAEPGFTLATNEIGTIGFYINDSVEILDTYGLSRIPEDRTLSQNDYLLKYSPNCLMYKKHFDRWTSLPDSFANEYIWQEHNGLRIGIHKNTYPILEKKSIPAFSQFIKNKNPK